MKQAVSRCTPKISFIVTSHPEPDRCEQMGLLLRFLPVTRRQATELSAESWFASLQVCVCVCAGCMCVWYTQFTQEVVGHYKHHYTPHLQFKDAVQIKSGNDYYSINTFTCIKRLAVRTGSPERLMGRPTGPWEHGATAPCRSNIYQCCVSL